MTEQVKTTVAVDGATGYVGTHLVHALCKKGIGVRAIVHPGANSKDCDFLLNSGAELFKTDLDAGSDTLKRALDGADCVVHLIGSIAPKKGQKLEDLHAGMTQHLLEANKGMTAKMLMITALGTAENAESLYHRSKWQAEELLRKSGHTYMILRPSLILGRQVGRRDSKLMARYIHLINTRPRVPVLGGGKNLLQPVFVGDLATAISKACLDASLVNKTIEIGGTEVLSMKDLLGKLMDALGKQKPLQPVPLGLAAMLAPILEMVQNVPLLSRDQVKLSGSDNICSDNWLEKLLESKPVSLAEALATYRAGEAN